MLPSQAWAQALAGIDSVHMDSRLKILGMTAMTVIIYWDWYSRLIPENSSQYNLANNRHQLKLSRISWLFFRYNQGI